MSCQNSFEASSRQRRQSAVLAVIEQEPFDVRQRVPDDPVPERHPPVHRRSLTHHVISQRRPAEWALNQEQSVNVLRDELRVLERKCQRVA